MMAEQEAGRTALVIVEDVRTGVELHREAVCPGDVGDLIARLVREREDAQGT